MIKLSEEGKGVILALTIGLGFIVATVALIGLTIIGLTWLSKALGV